MGKVTDIHFSHTECHLSATQKCNRTLTDSISETWKSKAKMSRHLFYNYISKETRYKLTGELGRAGEGRVGCSCITRPETKTESHD